MPNSQIQNMGTTISGNDESMSKGGSRIDLGTADFSDNEYNNEDYLGSSDSAL